MTTSINASVPTQMHMVAKVHESSPVVPALGSEAGARLMSLAGTLERTSKGVVDATKTLLSALRPQSTDSDVLDDDRRVVHAHGVLRRQSERYRDSVLAVTDEISRLDADVRVSTRKALGGDSSEQDFFDEIGDLIGTAKEGYLDVFAEALRKYTEFFEELTKILLELKVAASGDKNVSGNFLDIKNKLVALLDKYADIKVGPESSTPEDAKKLADELGPGFEARLDSNTGTWSVVIDTSTVRGFATSLPNKNGDVSNTEYNNIVSNKDSMTSSVNRGAQLAGENFSRANATYQNLIKLLSSLIESMCKMMEARLPS